MSDERTGLFSSWSVKWIGVAVFCVAVLVFALSWWGEFVLDDTVFLVTDERVSEPSEFDRLWTRSHWDSPRGNTLGAWRPVGLTSLAVVKWFAGDHAWPHHVLNTLIHGAVSLLVVCLAWQITRSRAVAAVTGLLFAVHPIHAEAVANVMGRLELLAALFALLAWWSHRSGKWGWTPLWLLLGVLSKESAITMVGVFVIDDLIGRPGVEGGRKKVVAAWVAIAVALLLYFVARWGVLGALNFTRREMSALVMNPLLDERVDLMTRWATGVGVLGRHWWVFIWPANLAADHSWAQIPLTTSLLDHPASTAGLFLLVLAVAGGLSIREHPVVALALALWACTASLTSNLLLPVGVLYAERLLYLPSLGFCLLVGWGAAWTMRRSALLRPVVIGVIALALLAATARSVRRTWDWGTPLRLWTHDVRVVPRASHAWFNYGIFLQFDGQFEAAREAHWQALELSRPVPNSAVPPHHQRCLRVLLSLLGQLIDEARVARDEQRWASLVDQYARALDCVIVEEITAEILSHRGRLTEERGEIEEARVWHERALERNPTNRLVLSQAGDFFRRRGEMDQAIALFRRALEVEPGNARVHHLLGMVLMATGDEETGQAHLSQAERLRRR